MAMAYKNIWYFLGGLKWLKLLQKWNKLILQTFLMLSQQLITAEKLFWILWYFNFSGNGEGVCTYLSTFCIGFTPFPPFFTTFFSSLSLFSRPISPPTPKIYIPFYFLNAKSACLIFFLYIQEQLIEPNSNV